MFPSPIRHLARFSQARVKKKKGAAALVRDGFAANNPSAGGVASGHKTLGVEVFRRSAD